MAWRDNTKTGVIKTVGAADRKQSSTLRSIARPGSRNHKVPSGADSVSSVNGKTPRPGYKQKSVPGGGTGSIARPGGNQHIRG